MFVCVCVCKNWDGVRGKKTTEMGGVREKNRHRERDRAY